MQEFSLSVIIPTFNEADSIAATIQQIQHQSPPVHIQLIVADGHSTDETCSIASRHGAIVIQTEKGRAKQMNAGAAIATGRVLYFLHADTLPPNSYFSNIEEAYRSGYHCGSFKLKFDINHWFLDANCWFTRFDFNPFRFGDQSLFVEKELFQKAGGFNETYIVLEDQEIISRLKSHGKFRVLNGSVTTSSRKYRQNGIYRTQAIFYLIYMKYCLGYSQQNLLKTYRSLIKQDKL